MINPCCSDNLPRVYRTAFAIAKSALPMTWDKDFDLNGSAVNAREVESVFGVDVPGATAPTAASCHDKLQYTEYGVLLVMEGRVGGAISRRWGVHELFVPVHQTMMARDPASHPR